MLLSSSRPPYLSIISGTLRVHALLVQLKAPPFKFKLVLVLDLNGFQIDNLNHPLRHRIAVRHGLVVVIVIRTLSCRAGQVGGVPLALVLALAIPNTSSANGLGT